MTNPQQVLQAVHLGSTDTDWPQGPVQNFRAKKDADIALGWLHTFYALAPQTPAAHLVGHPKLAQAEGGGEVGGKQPRAQHARLVAVQVPASGRGAAAGI